MSAPDPIRLSEVVRTLTELVERKRQDEDGGDGWFSTRDLQTHTGCSNKKARALLRDAFEAGLLDRTRQHRPSLAIGGSVVQVYRLRRVNCGESVEASTDG